jgi:cob(I)alamin adenosyltransferase
MDDPRIVAIVTVDELFSTVGVILAVPRPDDVRSLLTDVQHDLFDLGGELSIPGHAAVTGAHVARLEEAVERYNESLPMLKEFILPGGTRSAAMMHVARTVCRRAERRLVAMGDAGETPPPARVYLNRLSDLLFVLARTLNRQAGAPDVLWQKDRARGARE